MKHFLKLSFYAFLLIFNGALAQASQLYMGIINYSSLAAQINVDIMHQYGYEHYSWSTPKGPVTYPKQIQLYHSERFQISRVFLQAAPDTKNPLFKIIECNPAGGFDKYRPSLVITISKDETCWLTNV